LSFNVFIYKEQVERALLLRTVLTGMLN